MSTDPTEDMEERLEELEKGIQAARKKAEDDGMLPDPHHHKKTLADPEGKGEDDLPGTLMG